MRKTCLVFYLSVFISAFCPAQNNVGIGTTTPNPSAALDISSLSKGLLVPRMSSAQRKSIVSPAAGLLVFDSSNRNYWYYAAGRWQEIGSGSYSNSDNVIIGRQSGSPTGYSMGAFTFSSDSSGLLYDSGGPLGSYGNNELYQFSLYSSTGIDIKVLSMDTENPYDSLWITDDLQRRYVLHGNMTGNFRLYGNVHINFKSNAVNTGTGFVIRWDNIYLGNQQTYDSTQFAGWYYNAAKNYYRGGNNIGNNWSPDSSGEYSFAFGDKTKAKGKYSYALGAFNTAIDVNSWALGYGNTASGYSSIAMGQACAATNFISLAIGSFNIVNGNKSLALGADNQVDGVNSGAVGTGNTLSGDGAYAYGDFNDVDGYLGIGIGNSNDVKGNYSTAVGFGLKGKTYGGVVLGIYNDSTNAGSATTANSNNKIFQLGNGSSNASRSNALTILQNGNVGIGISQPNRILAIKAQTFSNVITMEETGTGNGFWISNTGTPAGTFIGTSTNNPFSLITNGTVRATIGPGGIDINSNLTVQGGKGMIRSSDGTQQKKVTALLSINTNFNPGETKSFPVTWPEAFSAGPDAFIGNITFATGGWAEILLTILFTSETGCTVYAYNPKTVAVNPNYTFKVIAIGPQ